MPEKKCEGCGESVLSTAQSCPHCCRIDPGGNIKRKLTPFIGIAALLALMLGAALAVATNRSVTPTAQGAVGAAATKPHAFTRHAAP